MNIIPKVSTEFYWGTIFSQAIPDRIVVGLVDQKAVNVDYTTNPFNFQHFDLKDVRIYVNGERRTSENQFHLRILFIGLSPTFRGMW